MLLVPFCVFGLKKILALSFVKEDIVHYQLIMTAPDISAEPQMRFEIFSRQHFARNQYEFLH